MRNVSLTIFGRGRSGKILRQDSSGSLSPLRKAESLRIGAALTWHMPRRWKETKTRQRRVGGKISSQAPPSTEAFEAQSFLCPRPKVSPLVRSAVVFHTHCIEPLCYTVGSISRWSSTPVDRAPRSLTIERGSKHSKDFSRILFRKAFKAKGDSNNEEKHDIYVDKSYNLRNCWVNWSWINHAL